MSHSLDVGLIEKDHGWLEEVFQSCCIEQGCDDVKYRIGTEHMFSLYKAS